MTMPNDSGWTIRIEGEADDTFDTMLACIGEGWCIDVTTGGEVLTCLWVGTKGRNIVVQPGATGDQRRIDFAEVDAIHIY